MISTLDNDLYLKILEEYYSASVFRTRLARNMINIEHYKGQVLNILQYHHRWYLHLTMTVEVQRWYNKYKWLMKVL
jgi:hypothetical protein